MNGTANCGHQIDEIGRMSQIAASIDETNKELAASNIATMKEYLNTAQKLMSFGNTYSYNVKCAFMNNQQMLLSVGPRGVTVFDEDNTVCRRIDYDDMTRVEHFMGRVTMFVMENNVTKEFSVNTKMSYSYLIFEAVRMYYYFFLNCHLARKPRHKQ